jgi:ubiquinone/menaquinone biosynthesis C-methylase UbiE
MSDSCSVNYNNVATFYDQRTASGYLDQLGPELARLAQETGARRVLDLGCGTGRSLETMLRHLQARPPCFGLDLSGGMLARAHHLDIGFRLVQASALWPPFHHHTFDLITSILSFHHFPDKPQVVEAALALLRPGGAFAISNFDPRDSENIYPIYEYFEGTYANDLRRFPSITTQKTMLRRAGFVKIRSAIVEIIDEEVVGDDILDNYWFQKNACSQLMLLTDEAYQAGIRRIQAVVNEAKNRNTNAVFRTQLKNWIIYGFKPPSPKSERTTL